MDKTRFYQIFVYPYTPNILEMDLSKYPPILSGFVALNNMLKP
jgi:hypothetical protein